MEKKTLKERIEIISEEKYPAGEVRLPKAPTEYKDLYTDEQLQTFRDYYSGRTSMEN